MMPDWLVLKGPVAESLQAGRPCVALESNVIAHGLPYPYNLRAALRAAQIIREAGATPATIGILGGQVIVGLDEAEIERFATAKGIRKVAPRDLPIAVSSQLDGATTVDATAWAAHRVGIPVFATGGIGGVHRGSSFDISADLLALAQTPVMVVCSGAKSILDLPATLEWLETHGVPVVGFGTDQLPAFYSRESGLPVDVRADTPEEVARLFQAQRALGLPGGMLVAVPVPAAAELPRAQMEATIGQALHEAEVHSVSGSALTPYLLDRVGELTDDASVKAFAARLENNAAVGARIAVALNKLD
jgi:pseudouridylate synthase